MEIEYESLRHEVLNRQDARNNLLLTNFVFVGVLFAAALGFGSPGASGEVEGYRPLLLLVVPIISGLFGSLTVTHDYSIKFIGRYIENAIEYPLGYNGWQKFRAGNLKKGWRESRSLASFIAFLLPIVISSALFFAGGKRPSVKTFSPMEYILLISAITSVAIYVAQFCKLKNEFY